METVEVWQRSSFADHQRKVIPDMKQAITHGSGCYVVYRLPALTISSFQEDCSLLGYSAM
jgi:hypothetical protein